MVTQLPNPNIHIDFHPNILTIMVRYNQIVTIIHIL